MRADLLIGLVLETSKQKSVRVLQQLELLIDLGDQKDTLVTLSKTGARCTPNPQTHLSKECIDVKYMSRGSKQMFNTHQYF